MDTLKTVSIRRGLLTNLVAIVLLLLVTIFGMTFCAVSVDHPLAQEMAQSNAALARYIEECRRVGTTEGSPGSSGRSCFLS